MMLSPQQFSCLTLLSAEEQLAAEKVNTLTLASLLRRGMVKAMGPKRKKYIVLTPLGTQSYKFNMSHKIRKWKEDLALARALKGRI